LEDGELSATTTATLVEGLILREVLYKLIGA